MHRRSSLALVMLVLVAVSARADTGLRVDTWVDAQLAGLVERYEHLHANPELSLAEVQTAALVARALEAAGYAVQAGIGGHGVVGVLENGAGPTLLIRGDMDGLPVTEATGLPYESQVTTQRPDGTTVGVMHACGHDVHVANLLGTAEVLAALRDAWAGTLIILAQPAEELGKGARMMIEDDLFEKIPMPDHAIALHVDGGLPAGRIGWTSGWAAANVDSVDITIHGRGGHGARPHNAIDPIVTAAHFVTALQTIVSRRVDPIEPAVITVGSIHGGAKHNVIPDEVKLQLTVRSYSGEVRKLLLDSIRQLANDTCQAFGCPKPPDVTIKDEYTPAMYNDPELAARAVEVFVALLGEDNVREMVAAMGGEDFGRYHRSQGFPAFMFRLGGVNESRWKRSRKRRGEPLPSLHSSRFAADPGPTLETGVRAMSRLALSLLGSSAP